MEEIMSKKREARIAYYQGLKEALSQHIAETEKGLRALPGLSAKKIDKLVATVRKQHAKLSSRIDRQFAEEIAMDKSLASDV
jgi:hypothetical protein